METERYKEEQNRIAQCAFNLFKKKGFDKTSIKDIADAAGIIKPLVQYYFPKKELFIRMFITRSLDIVIKSIENDNIASSTSFNTMYLMGYFETWYLTKHDSMKMLRNDIMSDRSYSLCIIETIEDFIFKTIAPDEKDRNNLQDAITLTAGAEFEYIHRRFVQGEEFNTGHLVDTMIKLMNGYLGFKLPEINVEDILSEKWLSDKAYEVDRIMFGE